MKNKKNVSDLNILNKWWFKVTAIFLLCCLIIFIASFFYEKAYADKNVLGLEIGGQYIGGLAYDEANSLIQKEVDDLSISGLTYKYLDKEIQLPFIFSATEDPDLTFQLATFDIEKTLEKSQNFGKSGYYFIDLYNKAKALLFGVNINLDFNLAEDELLSILKNNFFEYTQPAEDATYEIIEGQITVTAEKAGKNFNYQEIINKTKEQIATLDVQVINLQLISEYPEVYQNEVTEELINEVEQVIALEEIEFTFENEKWTASKDTFQEWFSLKKENKVVKNKFNALLEDYLEEIVAPDIEIEAQEAKFDLKWGKVTEFQSGNDGLELAIDDSINNINNKVFNQKQKQVELLVNVISTKTRVGSINDLGIVENIGTGESDFSGSPTNRVHNIYVGAGTLDGILIEPGETFSLINSLGNIDASSGYKQELVIKGDETIPEYGGGLCQIATTIFRAAIASGLPIVERRPHAYRVVYYEPAGKDATIYDPKPDVRFLNDTGKHILIQQKIVGSNLYFEFWGTWDNRVTEQSDSVIYNYTAPGPTKYILDETLEPDQMNCIESPHYGADAYFDYKVTYPDGEVNEERFSSHYVPWREVCLVGELSEEEPELDEGDNATSTPENIE